MYFLVYIASQWDGSRLTPSRSMVSCRIWPEAVQRLDLAPPLTTDSAIRRMYTYSVTPRWVFSQPRYQYVSFDPRQHFWHLFIFTYSLRPTFDKLFNANHSLNLNHSKADWFLFVFRIVSIVSSVALKEIYERKIILYKLFLTLKQTYQLHQLTKISKVKVPVIWHVPISGHNNIFS